MNSTIVDVAIKEKISEDSILGVLDRFHIAKLYRGELDKYCQKILRELKASLSKKEIIKELLSLFPELMEAYRLAIKLTHIFNTYQSKSEALDKFSEWISLVKKSKLTFFNKLIKTLKKLKNEISNYFIDRNTSGFAEGLNNKIKVLKRRCYGIFNVRRVFQRLHLDVLGYSILVVNS